MPTALESPIDDPEGTLLWAAPTAGPPISLAYVPAGTQCIIHLRPADILTHPEGELILAALGPWGTAKLEELRTITHLELSEMRSLRIAVIVDQHGRLDASLCVGLNAAITDDEFARRLTGAEVAEHGRQRLRVRDGRAYVQLQSAGSTGETTDAMLLIAPAELIQEVVESGGEAPSLVRDIEALAVRTDQLRAATVLIAPSFLVASGNELLTGEAKSLRDAIEWLLGNDVAAIALSAHWDENFFVELRAAPRLDVSPHRLAGKLQERISASSDAIEEIVLAEPWHPYGRRVLSRAPGMLRTLARYTRSGEVDRHAVVRCYLPPAAGHNLLMACELLLTQPREAAAGTVVETAPTPPTTLEQRLAARTSLVFAKDTLQRAIELLAADTGIPISIQGADLQLAGITKNQSFGIDLRDVPASEILVEVLRRANPDQKATGPADARQMLVYVLHSAVDGDPGRIIVTTRTAAEKRGDRLADPFLGDTR